VPSERARDVALTAVQATLGQEEVVPQTSVRVRQDEIRPHDIGIRAACARIDYDRMQVVACTNLIGTDGDKKALLQP
jgi:hypothetical protein